MRQTRAVTQRTPVDGPRHSAAWYDQSHEWSELAPGERMLIPCSGGPGMARLEEFPPRLEIPMPGGTYVLEDEGPRPTWRYVFLPA